MKAAGYIIQDKQGNAIYGIGATVADAWAMVVDNVGTFFDAYGNDVDPDTAYETQFVAYGATAALIEKVKAEGDGFAWKIIRGVACTLEEAE